MELVGAGRVGSRPHLRRRGLTAPHPPASLIASTHHVPPHLADHLGSHLPPWPARAALQILWGVWHRRRHVPLLRQNRALAPGRGGDAPGEPAAHEPGCREGGSAQQDAPGARVHQSRHLARPHLAPTPAAEIRIACAVRANVDTPTKTHRHAQLQYGTCWQYQPSMDPWNGNTSVRKFMEQ